MKFLNFFQTKIFLSALGLFATGCSLIAPTPTPTPTFTPEQAYSETISSALDKLDAWENGPRAELFKLLTETEVEFGFMHEKTVLYVAVGVCVNSPVQCNESFSYHETILTQVVPLMEQIASDGFAVKSAFGAVEPPPQVKVAHEQIVSCVDSVTQDMHEVASFFKTNLEGANSFSSPGMDSSSSDTDLCAFYDDSILQVRDFIGQNAP